MEKPIEHIIWGASIEGVKKAVELKQQGKKVLLLNKFGFPGGKYTESLCLFLSYKQLYQDDFINDLFQRIKKIKNGILFNRSDILIIHAEAIKATLWQIIKDHQLETLFHVVPVELEKNQWFSVFGKEGKIKLCFRNLTDCSDNQYLNTYLKKDANQSFDVSVHCFSNNIPNETIQDFKRTRQFDTKLGVYLSYEKKKIALPKIQNAFSGFLDEFSKTCTMKGKPASLILPASPMIKPCSA